MTLSEKQQLFVVMVANLIHWAEEHGYRLTFGEAYRTPEQAALNAKKGSGISNSLHTQRLAVDFNLFVNGQYKTRTEDYRPWANTGSRWAAAGAGASEPTRTAITSAWNITGCADGQACCGCNAALRAGICRRVESGHLAA